MFLVLRSHQEAIFYAGICFNMLFLGLFVLWIWPGAGRLRAAVQEVWAQTLSLGWPSLLLAVLPSCIFFLFIPFFWNNVDALGYLANRSLRFSMPHYPPLYNGLCITLMALFRGTPVSVYILVLLQHLIYAGGLLYVSALFSRALPRLVFLAAMAFNLAILIPVNGVFQEGLFAGIELFFWGSILRFFMPGAKHNHTGAVWAGSLLLLSLTKHIGQLWYVLPACAFLYLAIAFAIRRDKSRWHLAVATFKFGVISIFLSWGLQNALLWHFQSPRKVTIGRQGEIRIYDLPWKNLSPAGQEALLLHYTGWSSDTMLRMTYEGIIHREGWCEASAYIEQRLAAAHITNKNADDYLNEAYKAYILHLEHYGAASILGDCRIGLFTRNTGYHVIDDNRLDRTPYAFQWPEGLRGNWERFFNQQVYRRIDAMYASPFFAPADAFSISFLTFIALMLFIFCLFQPSRRVAFLFLIPAGFAWFSIAVNCVITGILPRYMLAAYSEAYLAAALLGAYLFTPKGRN